MRALGHQGRNERDASRTGFEVSSTHLSEISGGPWRSGGGLGPHCVTGSKTKKCQKWSVRTQTRAARKACLPREGRVWKRLSETETRKGSEEADVPPQTESRAACRRGKQTDYVSGAGCDGKPEGRQI